MAHLEKRDATRTQAEALLTSACRILASSSPQSVAALVSLLPLDQCDGEPADWASRAAALADAHHLQVDVSANETHMRVRFSRPPG